MRIHRLNLKARRGSTLVMTGIMVVAFVAVGAIAADIGRFYVVTTELQTAADAAALAGALQLQQTPGLNPKPDVDTAVVNWVANTNRADSRGLSVTASDVTMLWYVPPDSNGVGEVLSGDVASKRPNAVRVTVTLTNTRGTFSQFLGQSLGLDLQRKAVAWVANLGSNCVRPWAFPYRALYSAVSGNANPPTPAPDLDPVQFSSYVQRPAGQRMFTILGQNQTSTLSNDGEWNGFNFTGNAGRASFVDGIEGCTNDKINPDAGQGVTLPGQAGQYVTWSLQAVFGGGNGNNATDGICAQKAPLNAGCYVTAADTAPGVTINSAWGELLGNGSNGIDFDYVGEFVMTCFYSTSNDVCPVEEPGTPNTGYPPGTIVGYVKTLKSRTITPDDVLGNFSSNVQRIILVK
jgi:Flp pilus assembly protein TadG